MELEDAATSAAAQATAAGAGSGTGTGRHSSLGGDERPRSAAAGGFWFGLDTRHVEDAPGLAVIKRHPGGLEPAKRRPLQSQLQVHTHDGGTIVSYHMLAKLLGFGVNLCTDAVAGKSISWYIGPIPAIRSAFPASGCLLEVLKGFHGSSRSSR